MGSKVWKSCKVPPNSIVLFTFWRGGEGSNHCNIHFSHSAVTFGAGPTTRLHWRSSHLVWCSCSPSLHGSGQWLWPCHDGGAGHLVWWAFLLFPLTFYFFLSQLELTYANGGEPPQWFSDGPLRSQAHLGAQLRHRHRRLCDPLLCSKLPASPSWLPPQWIFSGLRPAHCWSLHLWDCNCSLAWLSCFYICPHTEHGVNLSSTWLWWWPACSGISMASWWGASCPFGCSPGWWSSPASSSSPSHSSSLTPPSGLSNR